VFHQPAKGSLDDPAFGQHGKTALVFEARHRLQANCPFFDARLPTSRRPNHLG
jgi:hypothetical protein